VAVLMPTSAVAPVPDWNSTELPSLVAVFHKGM